jgi:hypothetical protein
MLRTAAFTLVAVLLAPHAALSQAPKPAKRNAQL